MPRIHRTPSTKFTTLPCGLKLRLDVMKGEFTLKGNMGDRRHMDNKNPITKLNIVPTSTNLLALSAFFLARAQERMSLK